MEINNTAYNEFVFCSDCEHGLGNFVSADQEFTCPRWGTPVKNVGICKYYKRIEDGKDTN